MVFLKWLAALTPLFIFLTPDAFAGSEDTVIDERAVLVQLQSQYLCNSTQEYIQTLKFLRTNKDLAFPENTSRLIAEKVARGCDGASARFAKVLLILKNVGLSDLKAIELALDFAAQKPEVQRNFVEIFTHSFLSEFFDYEYPTAVHLAMELSRDYSGDPVQAREDFLALVRHCKDGHTLDLPNSVCAQYTIKLAHLSQYFPGGVREPFFHLLKDLRERKEFSLNLKAALDVSYNVLKSGPRAPDNFFKAFDFALEKDGLDLNQKEALAFAVRMADRSFVGDDHPPAIPASFESAKIGAAPHGPTQP